jgi:hypothetical protein
VLAEALTLDQDETIESAAHELTALRQELSEFDPVKVIAGCAALAALADNHTRIFRIDSLIHLAALHCAGTKVPTGAEFARWFNAYLTESHIVRFEDPPEDFAIGNVCTPVGDRLVFNGEWSGPDQILQDVLDAVETGPASLDGLRASGRAMLALSDLLAKRYGYSRDTAGSIDLIEVQIPPTDSELRQLSMLLVFAHVRRTANGGANCQNQTTPKPPDPSLGQASNAHLPDLSAHGDCMVRPEEDRECEDAGVIQ